MRFHISHVMRTGIPGFAVFTEARREIGNYWTYDNSLAEVYQVFNGKTGKVETRFKMILYDI